MKTFLPLTCFALIATAAANGGYNYQPQRASNIVSNNIYSSQQAPPLAVAPLQGYAASSSPYSGQAVQAAYTPSFGGVSSSVQSGYNSQVQQQTIVSKDFYIHSAADEYEEVNADQGGIEAGPNRKNYHIVFIKAPSHNVRVNINSLKQAQALNEQKTIIYVLSKKPDIIKNQNQVSATQIEQQVHKPEVYFIKYKTQEEAQRAQQEIQSQYEALGGSTRVSDEGLAQVTSVIGNSGSFSGGSSFVQSASSGQPILSGGGFQSVQSSYSGSLGSGSSLNLGVSAPSSKYLPAKKK